MTLVDAGSVSWFNPCSGSRAGCLTLKKDLSEIVRMNQPIDPFSDPQPKQSSLGFLMVLMALAGAVLGWYVLRPMLNGVGGGVKPAIDAETLADLQLAPLTEGSSDLTLDETAGKIVLINFWGTWCPPCRAEFPDVVALEAKYRNNNDVLIVPVSCGNSMRENVDELRTNTEAFLKQHDTNMPNYTDPGLVTRKAVNDAVGFRGYPTTVLLDGQHRIRELWVGKASYQEMNSSIEALLNEHQQEAVQAN